MRNAQLFAALALLSLASCAMFNRPVDVPPPPTHRSASGIAYQDTLEGTGAPAAFGSLVKVHYVGMLLDGTQFDSSYDRGTPLQFTIGKGEAMKGLDEGLLGMRVGGKRHMIVPPELAYGAQGLEGLVPPNSSIVLDVELLESIGP